MKSNQINFFFLLIVLYLLSFWIFVSIFILFWGFGLISFGFLNSLATFLLPILCAFGYSISFLAFRDFFLFVFLGDLSCGSAPELSLFSFLQQPLTTKSFQGCFFFRGTLKIQGLKLKLDLTEMSSVSF